MEEIRIIQKNAGIFTFYTRHYQLRTLGEFLTVDVASASDFVRAILVSPTNEHVTMLACTVTMQNEVVTLEHLSLKYLPSLALKATAMIDLIDQWETMIMQQLAESSIFLSVEDIVTNNQENAKLSLLNKKSESSLV